MTAAFITAALSYLGGEFITAALARLGIVGVRATVAKTTGMRFLPLVAKGIKHLHERRKGHAMEDSVCGYGGETPEHHDVTKAIQALQAIDGLSDAQKSLVKGYFE